MRKLGFILVLTAVLGIQAFPQCSGKLLEVAAAHSGTDALFIRDFPVKLEEGSFKKPSPVARFQVLLTEGIRYRFNLVNANDFEGKAIMQLYDRTKLLGSSFNLETKSDSQAFEYLCDRTGTYQVLMSFFEGKRGCAVGIMSMILSDSMSVAGESSSTSGRDLEKLYIGVKNELNIAATNIPGGSLEVSISQGTIEGDNGRYFVRVEKEGIARIKVIARDKKGNISEIDSIDFKVSYPPLPIVTLDGKQGGLIFRNDIDKLYDLSLNYQYDTEGFLYEITQFTISPKNNEFSGETSYSKLLTSSQKLLIGKLGPGEGFIIKNILIKDPYGKIHTAKPLTFILE